MSEAFIKAVQDEYESDAFKHGVDVGESIGRYDNAKEAIAAHAAGELELWLEFQRPKTLEDWADWESEHGTLDEARLRWGLGPSRERNTNMRVRYDSDGQIKQSVTIEVANSQ